MPKINKTIFDKIIIIINITLIIFAAYFFIVLSGKYLLKTQRYQTAKKIFKLTKQKKWHFLSLIKTNDKQKIDSIIKSQKNDEFTSIYNWVIGNNKKAEDGFRKANNKEYLAYALYKNNKISETKTLLTETDNIILQSHLLVDNNKYVDAANNFHKIKNYSGLFKIFLKLHKFETAIFYLLMQKKNFQSLLSSILQLEDLNAKQISYLQKITDPVKINWIRFLTGNTEAIKDSPELLQSTALITIFYLLQGDIINCLNSYNESQSSLLEKITEQNEIENEQTIKNIAKKNPDIKTYDIIPKNIHTDIEIDSTHFIIFSAVLILLITCFFLSLFFLYRKYQANIVLQRQKDLEKMDALSIAKMQQKEAKKKRDKTELNVSSFITLNIQVEVLDIAYTKLGLRVNPNKLAEQLEKTKIPNISYKLYTVSNTYGLKVKMLTVRSDELVKHQKEGTVILVLKGDLIALLKNADNTNAYLQFSQKDSRKVPFSALKLSWEGNIIILNL